MAKTAITAALLLASVALCAPGAEAQGNCFTDWSVATPIVKKEGLVTIEQLSTLARAKLEGDIVKASLCDEKGSYVFRLVVRSANGQLKSVTVDARAPFGR